MRPAPRQLTRDEYIAALAEDDQQLADALTEISAMTGAIWGRAKRCADAMRGLPASGADDETGIRQTKPSTDPAAETAVDFIETARIELRRILDKAVTPPTRIGQNRQGA